MTDWQIGIWDRMAEVYADEVDRRFAPVVEGCVARAALRPGDRVLDLGCGTGEVARLAAPVAESVMAVDISPEMRAVAAARAPSNVQVVDGSAESIPADHGAFDAVIASLSLMFVLDRAAAASEIGRVLAPGGRLVASVWGDSDLVRFQALAARSSPPPAPDVGPGALADPGPLLSQLGAAGIEARVEAETVVFSFDSFDQAWAVFGPVTASVSDPVAKEAAAEMWPEPSAPREFVNEVLFVVGRRRA